MLPLLPTFVAFALLQGPPNLLHFQARLSDAGGVAIAGPVTVEVRIYDVALAGVPLWSEIHNATALNGVVNLLLGSIAVLPSALFDGTSRYVALKVGADPEMTPRRAIASVPFARRAATVAALDASTTIPAGLIAATQIADGAVTSAKIGAGAVATISLQAGSVTAAKLAANVIDSTKIADGSIAAADLASPLSGTGVGAPVLRADATGNGGIALQGSATNGAGTGFGVRGECASTGGVGVYGRVSAGTGSTEGVYGQSDSVSGTGVEGWASAATGTTYGVFGSSESTSGTGVYGFAAPATGGTRGVFGRSDSTSGRGVYAWSTAATGTTFGVESICDSTSGKGVLGRVTAATGVTDGVSGTSSSTSGAGVTGYATAATGTTFGLYAQTSSSSGRGVYGLATSLAGTNYGVRGQCTSAAGFGVYALGDFGGNGAKYFVQPHPTDASKEIRFVCLEGNESGTYFRGTGKIAAGRAVIEVPEEFRLVSEASGLTVQLTPVGDLALLCVESQNLERITVRASADVSFAYFVNGVRRGFAEHTSIRENQGWVPEVRGVPFGMQYPAALRKILVENGTLNHDFTPKEETAARMGWTLRSPEEGER